MVTASLPRKSFIGRLSEQIMGRPAAIASISVCPKLSTDEAKTKISFDMKCFYHHLVTLSMHNLTQLDGLSTCFKTLSILILAESFNCPIKLSFNIKR